jgi:hypothetical protein
MGSIMPLVVEVVTMERGHHSWQSGELIAKIEPFVVAYNTTKAPFNWTATADSILEKLKQLCAQISRTAN